MGTRGSATWRGAPKPLPPRPDGLPLEVSVGCRTSPDFKVAPPTRHLITIDPDWSVRTPHDLDAERVAAAFGGYLSCLTLIDLTIPATREWLRRNTRAVMPRMTFHGQSGWRIKETASCCPRVGFADAQAAAEHWRSRQHIAEITGIRRIQLSEVVSAVRSAHVGHSTLTIPEVDRGRAAALCIRGDLDVAWLWSAGIHPRWISMIHSKVAVDARMPARFFLGVLWNRPDLRWIADTLAGHDDPNAIHAGAQSMNSSALVSADALSTWLAWSAAGWDAIEPTARRRWLETGVSRPMILALGGSGYDPDEVVAHAAAVGRTADGVARTIGAWIRNGFTPSPAKLTALARLGIPPGSVPSKAAVARLRTFLEHSDVDWSDTELALLLVEHGTVVHTAEAMSRGARPCA